MFNNGKYLKNRKIQIPEEVVEVVPQRRRSVAHEDEHGDRVRPGATETLKIRFDHELAPLDRRDSSSDQKRHSDCTLSATTSAESSDSRAEMTADWSDLEETGFRGMNC